MLYVRSRGIVFGPLDRTRVDLEDSRPHGVGECSLNDPCSGSGIDDWLEPGRLSEPVGVRTLGKPSLALFVA